MKYLYAIILAALVCLSFLPGKSGPPKKFTKLLDDNGMQFNMPDSFKEVKIHDNSDMVYNFALKHEKKKLEVRYSIFPIATDSGIKAGKADATFAKQLLWTNIHNIADSVLNDTMSIDPAAIKKEFGADWGGFAYIIPKKTFATDFKYCLIVAIHKDNIAEGYIIYLFDNPNDVGYQMYQASFHSLTFKMN